MRTLQKISPILLAIALLAGCRRDGEAALREWQRALSTERFAFTAHITSLADDLQWRYTAAVCSSPEESTVTLTEPETLRGLCYRRGEGRELEYDGAVLALPAVTPGGLTPAEAPFVLCRALRTGRLVRCTALGEGWELELTGEGEEQVLAALDGEKRVVRASLLSEGRSVITMEIVGFGPEGE